MTVMFSFLHNNTLLLIYICHLFNDDHLSKVEINVLFYNKFLSFHTATKTRSGDRDLQCGDVRWICKINTITFKSIIMSKLRVVKSEDNNLYIESHTCLVYMLDNFNWVMHGWTLVLGLKPAKNSCLQGLSSVY